MHTQKLVHELLDLEMMFLTDNYKTLKLWNLSVENLDDKLETEVFCFIGVLVVLMTNGEYSSDLSESKI